MFPTTINRTIATTLSAAAIAGTIGVPAASAMPIDAGVTYSEASEEPIVAPTPVSNGPVAEPVGFDVSSAAIGAAAGTGLVMVVLAAGGLAWRRPMARGRRVAGA